MTESTHLVRAKPSGRRIPTGHRIMKRQIMLDLHFEMHVAGGAELFRELDPSGGSSRRVG